MSTQITTAFVNQFSSNIFHLSQQKGSRLRGSVRRESIHGDKGFFDRIGSVTATIKSGRHSDTPLIDTPHSRRMITMNDYEHADLIDDADRVRLLIDPESAYSQAFMFAFGRAMDDEIIAAASGNAFSGNAGATAVALGNAQKLHAVNSAGDALSNMNVEALTRAKELLDAADVDPSIRRYCAIQSSQLTSLLSETKTISSDFNTVRALVRGEIDEFLGFTFIRLERLANQSGALLFDLTTGLVDGVGSDGDGNRKALCWAEDGLMLGVGTDIKGRISERDDKSYSTQVFASMTVGATRMEEAKVVEILCKE